MSGEINYNSRLDVLKETDPNRLQAYLNSPEANQQLVRAVQARLNQLAPREALNVIAAQDQPTAGEQTGTLEFLSKVIAQADQADQPERQTEPRRLDSLATEAIEATYSQLMASGRMQPALEKAARSVLEKVNPSLKIKAENIEAILDDSGNRPWAQPGLDPIQQTMVIRGILQDIYGITQLPPNEIIDQVPVGDLTIKKTPETMTNFNARDRARITGFAPEELLAPALQNRFEVHSAVESPLPPEQLSEQLKEWGYTADQHSTALMNQGLVQNEGGWMIAPESPGMTGTGHRVRQIEGGRIEVAIPYSRFENIGIRMLQEPMQE